MAPWGGTVQLTYGTYEHDDNEVWLSVHKTPIYNRGGQLYGLREHWVINGFLQADNPDDLEILIADLEDAYAVSGQTAKLLNNDGDDSPYVLDTTEAIGGVRVVKQPSYPELKGAELTTFVHYAIELEAEFRDERVQLISWSESIHFTGGGPRFVFRQPLRGLPQKQQVAESTPYHATQRGKAVGHTTWPVPAAPIWTTDEHLDRRKIDREDPTRYGVGGLAEYAEFPVSWSYEFEGVVPFDGQPTLWR